MEGAYFLSFILFHFILFSFIFRFLLLYVLFFFFRYVIHSSKVLLFLDCYSLSESDSIFYIWTRFAFMQLLLQCKICKVDLAHQLLRVILLHIDTTIDAININQVFESHSTFTIAQGLKLTSKLYCKRRLFIESSSFFVVKLKDIYVLNTNYKICLMYYQIMICIYALEVFKRCTQKKI